MKREDVSSSTADATPTYLLMVMGSDDSGRTSLINEYSHKTTAAKPEPTLQYDRSLYQYNNNDEKMTVVFIDRPGSKVVRPQRIPRDKPNVILIVCDLTSSASIAEIQQWQKECQIIYGEIPIILLGNKCDLASEQELDAFRQVADKLELPSFIVSAKEGTNITESFEGIISFVSGKISKIQLMGQRDPEDILKAKERGDKFEALGMHYSRLGGEENIIKALHCFLHASVVDESHPLNETLIMNLLEELKSQPDDHLPWDVEDVEEAERKLIDQISQFKEQYDPKVYLAKIQVEEYEKLRQAMEILEKQYVKKSAGIFRQPTHSEEISSLVNDIKSGKINFFSELLEKLDEFQQKDDYNPAGRLARLIPKIRDLESTPPETSYKPSN